jgi:hypothetical protein
LLFALQGAVCFDPLEGKELAKLGKANIPKMKHKAKVKLET